MYLFAARAGAAWLVAMGSSRLCSDKSRAVAARRLDRSARERPVDRIFATGKLATRNPDWIPSRSLCAEDSWKQFRPPSRA